MLELAADADVDPYKLVWVLHPSMAAILLPMEFTTATDWSLPWEQVGAVSTRVEFMERIETLKSRLEYAKDTLQTLKLTVQPQDFPPQGIVFGKQGLNIAGDALIRANTTRPLARIKAQSERFQRVNVDRAGCTVGLHKLIVDWFDLKRWKRKRLRLK